jgi:hypothetical protein
MTGGRVTERAPEQDEQDSAEVEPEVDFSKSLGSAGHEAEDLGYDNVADTGDTVHAEEDDAEARRARMDYEAEFPGD